MARAAPVAKRERAVPGVLVVFGLGAVVTTADAPVTYYLPGPPPTGGTTAPMFWTILAVLGVFLVLAARNPAAYRTLIAYAVWSSFAHTAVMAVMALPLPTPRRDLLPHAALARLCGLPPSVLPPRHRT